MQFDITHNGLILTLTNGTKDEFEKLSKACSASEYLFQAKRTVTESYLRMHQYVMSGLWHRVMSIQQQTNIPVCINNIFDDDIGLIDKSISKESLDDYIEQNEFKYTPRWYQFDAVYYALKYKISRSEVATAGGKSYMMFLYSRYLIQNNKIPKNSKILIITIRRMLVTQLVDDFADYESTSQDKLLFCDTVFSGGRKLEQSNIVIGTYQTLSGYDPDYFKQFGAIVIDECHQAAIKSIKDEIIPKLDPTICKYRYGLSGTQPLKGTLNDLHLEAHMGPILFKINAHELQDEGAIAKIQINQILLKYPKHICNILYNAEEMASPQIPTQLRFERTFVQQNMQRNGLIKTIASKVDGNQVILVETVAYADLLVEILSAIDDKQVYRISGSTKDADRNYIKSQFVNNNNLILVATYECMSTGVSINNIHAIHFPDGGKSRVRMRQSCGRGLRLHPSKEFLSVYDYFDLFPKFGETNWGGPQINRLYNQGKARKKIYNEEKFPIKSLTFEIK